MQLYNTTNPTIGRRILDEGSENSIAYLDSQREI